MIIYIFFFLLFCRNLNAWDSGEIEMFDLVEEVKESFYDVLGIPQSADNAEIKRAYRRLSAKLHPDKNPDDPSAEAKFRRLVSIYEVLKNSELRTRRLTLEDQLSSTLKRHKARDRKLELINQEISDELQKIPGPGWIDLLPFAIIRWVHAIITFVPILYTFVKEKVTEKIQEHRELKEEMRIIQENKEKLKAEKQQRKRRLLHEQTNLREIEKEAGQSTIKSVLMDLPDVETDGPDEVSKTKPGDCVYREWSEKDVSSLVRAVVRYPGVYLEDGSVLQNH
ncbi:unnamed protein product [Heterobilharzia americana]|nr:unnamed protein product [Heterobilharzia americana]